MTLYFPSVRFLSLYHCTVCNGGHKERYTIVKGMIALEHTWRWLDKQLKMRGVYHTRHGSEWITDLLWKYLIASYCQVKEDWPLPNTNSKQFPFYTLFGTKDLVQSPFVLGRKKTLNQKQFKHMEVWDYRGSEDSSFQLMWMSFCRCANQTPAERSSLL